ncbi:major facilitator superfamily protein [Haloferax elongans ATCC BAA-1513]|uniref:Major facilitator superfamily protein n=1 Tax=Haloferax elongans ATCC BAA-1513 TaxID=1230453 RepID=M0HBG5_HALEO|nr:MFS transporter [Haloferax elongans]ELZ81027.1 major facilitator superfamily protein [Haloferax elongans ATCC BAA-1513]
MTTRPTRSLRLTPHLAVASVGYVVFAYAAVPDALMAAYGVGFTEIGLLMSAALAAFVLVQAPTGRLTSKTATTRLLLYGTAAHALLAVLLDVVSGFAALLALRALWGLAGGFVLSVGATHIARLYSGQAATRQQGLYGGMLTLGGAVGFAVAPALVEEGLLHGFGSGLLHSPGAVLATPALVVLARERHDTLTVPKSGTSPGTFSSTLTLAVALASLCYVAIIASYITLSTFITAYAADIDVTGPLNVAVLLTATLGRATGGAAVFQFSIGDPWFIAGATALAAACFAGLAGLGTSPLTLVLPVAAMLAVSVPFGAVFSVAADAAVHEGAAIAVVVAAGNVAALVLPAVTGMLRDATGTYASGFALLAGLNVVAVGAATLLGTNRFSQTHQT